MMNLGFMVMEKLDIVNDVTSARILKPVLMQKQKNPVNNDNKIIQVVHFTACHFQLFLNPVWF